jgi:hypothetical protein
MRRATRPAPQPSGSASDSVIVAKAMVRAADRLEVQNRLLARIIGLSEATISRLRKGDYLLDGKALELAIMFIRLYRSLDAVVGGDDAVAKAWLKNRNTALKDSPLALIQTVSGLTDVLHYLDARRAVV